MQLSACEDLTVVTNNVILIAGQEGAGKSTLVRALLPLTCAGAQIDAEDVGQVNPCLMDTALLQLLRRNAAQLVLNFWAAGYRNVIAGSIANTLGVRRLPRPAAARYPGLPGAAAGVQGGARPASDDACQAEHSRLA